MGRASVYAQTSSDTTTDPDVDAATDVDAAIDVAADLDTSAQTHQTHQYTSVLVNRCANAPTRSHQHTASNEYAIYSTYLNTRADRHPDAGAHHHGDVGAHRHADAGTNHDPDARADRHGDARADRHADARAHRHADVRAHRHADARANRHADARANRHADAAVTPIAALFVLAVDVWQGAPVLRFVGAAALGVIGPLGTWVITRRYPETDRAAWVCIGLTGAGVAIMALPRLVVLLWA